MTKKLHKKHVDAVNEIENAINDALANRDNTVALDPKTVQLVVDCAKIYLFKTK
jgi:hypothetical protein